MYVLRMCEQTDIRRLKCGLTAELDCICVHLEENENVERFLSRHSNQLG